MEKANKIIPQVYGYAVCLIAVITFLIAITAFVNAIIDCGDPIHSGFTPQGSPSLASFENYKADMLRSNQGAAEKNNAAYTPDDQTLKAMYASARNEKIQSSQHQNTKNILISSIVLLICLVLFFTHWRWMRKMLKAA